MSVSFSMRGPLQIHVPSDWYGKPWGYVISFDEAQKALNSDEQKRAVALMKKIDKQLGIEAELTSGIYESPDGASVVIVHDIKTPLDGKTCATSQRSKERRCWTSPPIQRSPNEKEISHGRVSWQTR